MREILFRGQTRRKGEIVYAGTGKPVDGKWVYGGITQGTGDFSVMYSYSPVEKHVVYTDTVGQFTGLTDKNGKKIFEGDILKSSDGTKYVVEWDTENARFLGFSVIKNERYIVYVGREPKSEVIGNIHDDPELLKDLQNGDND